MTLADIEASFANFARLGIGVLAVSDDPYPPELRRAIVQTAARQKIPAIYSARMFIDDGGLMSFGLDLVPAWRDAGDYAGKLLKGAKPDDLPVLRPTKIELTINRAAVKAANIALPEAIASRASEAVN